MLSRRGSSISYLFFAGDLLLFERATVDGVECLYNVLSHFCSFSGHKVSNQKTQVFFSSNVRAEMVAEVCAKLGYQPVESLEKYLGMLLFHHKVGRNSFSFILDKVCDRLNG